jgi:hypothetical protein
MSQFQNSVSVGLRSGKFGFEKTRQSAVFLFKSKAALSKLKI